ncbi:MAG: FliI/YscN family ATPase [Candidatus Desulfofervidaceae bacterium]|nr:FliI/YscN family ATPase [Candidatus Desulfofervidaceae bacterium]MDL1969678.1 FliI/YscN family ATPase [Candidatus Desulfofervidaceae bacterium]
MESIHLDKYYKILTNCEPILVKGKVTKVVGLVVEGAGIKAAVGDICEIVANNQKIEAEVIGFKENSLLLMPFGEMHGVLPGSEILHLEKRATVRVSEKLLGRIINALGEPLDDKGPIPLTEEYYLYATPSNPLTRTRISAPMDVGIRAINGLLTLGKGQRVGIFAGSGVGKTTLLGMMVKYAKADVKVIALIGERGREVRDFVEKHIKDALDKTVLIVATSDQPPLLRMRGAFVATAIAEFFRDQGKDVLLIMDSLTRFAMAQRELGLSAGEPPTTKGYTPSVFAVLPKLLERAGSWEKGSITALYTVLVEADDMNDPIADASRAILDGHIVLSRELARQNQYPPIDVLSSISRVMVDVTDKEHLYLANRFRDTLATYKSAEDLINIGAYVKGSNPHIDQALHLIDKIKAYLKQDIDREVSLEKSLTQLKEIFHENI